MYRREIQKPQRKPNRLKDFDYSSNGFYFVTICIQNRECVLGQVRDFKMSMNQWGIIVKNCWLDLPNHYKNCFLDAWMIMPNHFHGIIRLDDSNIVVGTGFKPVRSRVDKWVILSNDDAEWFQTIPYDQTDVDGFETRPYKQTNKIYPLSEIIRGFKTFSS